MFGWVMEVLPEGTVVGGRYVIGARIGNGAMGTVYRARHAKVRREFAIKVLHRSLMKDPKVLKRFEREAELAGRLRHHNVVAVVDVGVAYNGLRYMAMELAPGASLGQMLLDGPLSEARVLDLAKQLCAGLAHAHDLGLVHRDFKPDNVLVEQVRGGREVARIVDFGVAILREDVADQDGDRLTTKGLVVGTPHYMAPEQARGGTLDHRADIYALGLTMYEMLTGVLPFEGTGVEVAQAHVRTLPPRLRERAPDCHVDPNLEDIVMRMLEKAPGDRYATADEILQALTALERERSNPRALVVTGHQAPISRPHSVVEPELDIRTDKVEPIDDLPPIPRRSRPLPASRRRVRPIFYAAAVAAVAICVGLATWRLSGHDDTESVAAIDVATNEPVAAWKDERIHREAPPPAPDVPHILEQPDKRGIVVEVPLPPSKTYPSIPSSVTSPPSASEVAKLYASIGRELRALEASKGMDATIELWPRYRWIRINDAMVTPEKRVETTIMLQRLLQDIRDEQRRR